MATEKKEGRATVKTCGFERIDVAENKLRNVAYERLRNFLGRTLQWLVDHYLEESSPIYSYWTLAFSRSPRNDFSPAVYPVVRPLPLGRSLLLLLLLFFRQVPN